MDWLDQMGECAGTEMKLIKLARYLSRVDKGRVRGNQFFSHISGHVLVHLTSES